MDARDDRVIVVTGATGLQGGSVVRCLLRGGWRVSALTRSPQSERARALAALGAEVVQGDMDDPRSLARAFSGAYGVYSVQNPVISGIEGEINQGKNVARAARDAGIQHVVYASAGIGARGAGVPSWESKTVIEDYLKSLEIPLTILRPTAFMEIMTEKKFFPPVSTWNVMPALMGGEKKVVWFAADDLGFVAAKVFAESETFAGQELNLVSDVRSIDECRELYRQVSGKLPGRFPMPPWLFERFGFIGKDLTIMWRWLRDAELPADTGPTLAVHPEAMSVEAFLKKRLNAAG